MRRGIAIVGIACRYPDARTPSELWENVLARRRAFRRLPPERLRLEDYFNPDRTLSDTIYSTQAAVIDGWELDRVRYKVTGRAYRSADLAHWLALDTAALALADGGFADGEGLPRDATMIVIGNSLTGEFSRANLMRLRWPYVRRTVGAELLAAGWTEEQCGTFLARLEASYKRPYPEMTEESLAGGLANTIAGRVANHFDLRGGGYTVDGACSSSLLAVCQACSALVAGDADVALAGGVDLSIDPFELVGFARTGALTPDEMRVYDRRSQGFIPGEGSGFAVLMREDDAREQGRRIYAVVRGWGISSDGAGGITRPEVDGQILALERAYRRAGFGAERVGFFEGHGTGTKVGDATELAVLTRIRREAGARGRPAGLGSIKANIGHTKAAAGLAAFLKATLAAHHQLLPPTTGCEEPHELLTDGEPAVRVLADGELWSGDQPLVTAASAMGFGGINTHVVIEGEVPVRRRGFRSAERRLLASHQDAELFVFAAAEETTLAAEIARWQGVAPRLSRSELADAAVVLAARATPARWRAAVVASTPAELAERLETLGRWLAEGESFRLDRKAGVFLGRGATSRSGGAPRIGLLCTGQGSQAYPDGGALARRFESVAELWRSFELPAEGDLVDTANAQPRIVAASLAGLSLLSSLGIEGSVAVGHSLGEITALAWAGSLGENDAVALAAARGRAMSELGSEGGAMLSVALDGPSAEVLAGRHGLAVAAFNGLERTVLSGAGEAVDAAQTAAAARGIEATRLKVSHAFHSPLVAAAAPRLAERLRAIPLAAPRRAVSSTIAGRPLAPGDDLAALLVAQVTSPVRFVEAVRAVASEVDLWIEVGPGRALANLAGEISGAPAIALDPGSPSLTGVLAAAAAAWAFGLPVELAALFDGRFVRPFDPDREPRFFVNPCELAPLPGIAAVSVETVQAAEAAPAFAAGGEASSEERSPLAVVRALVAARAELPPSAVADDSRLLSDLHLNSISVGQLVADAARALGARPPLSPTDYANATVAQLAEVLAESEPVQSELGASADGRGLVAALPPPGIEAWVRPFRVDLIERPPRPRPALPASGWRLFAPPAHPLAASLEARLATAGGGGVLLCLPAASEPASSSLLLEAARAAGRGETAPRFVVVQSGGGGGGLARTLVQEMPHIATAVIDVPFDDPRALDWVVSEALTAEGYVEAHYDREGRRRTPVLRLFEGRHGALPLGSGDVLLVTGGGKGIAVECALAWARASGVRLALLGRSRPEADAELAANLERLRAAGATIAYAPADVTDAQAVARAVAELEAQLGEITGVLHAAGTNQPRLLADLDEAELDRTLAPKTGGLANVLAAVEPARLRTLVVFGSIIARIGMRGEAHYATANERMGLALEAFAAAHPSCRCLNLEWSVWAGVGMGERLGRIEALRNEGVTPIAADVGIDLFLRLLAAEDAPTSIVVAGRCGAVPTLHVEEHALPLLRFLDRPRFSARGVELVVDIELSSATDPYLADHVFRGERLFPAVMGLEAMVQVAQVLAEDTRLPVLERVELARPIVVPERGTALVRVAGLVRGPGLIELALRSEATGFQVDCFRAFCRFPADGEAGAHATLGPRLLDDGAVRHRLALEPLRDLYGAVLFHEGRFRRLESYDHLLATECSAMISADGSTQWFGHYLPPDLLLGDAGARDAAIHGIQPCIPHATILPTGIDRLELGWLDPAKPLSVAARERWRQGDDFLYDLEISDDSGQVVERWQGLHLRAVQRLPQPRAWQVAMLAPYLERRLEELLPAASAKVLVEGRPSKAREISDAALARVLARSGATLAEVSVLRRRADGKPETLDGLEASLSHTDDLLMAVSGASIVRCDIEPIAARSAESWRDLLGAERSRLVDAIVAERGEARDAAATRVWAAMECLQKASVVAESPLVMTASPTEDGWLLLRSGRYSIATLVTAVAEPSRRVALAVLAEEAH